MTTRAELSAAEGYGRGHTPLMRAALDGNTERVKELIGQGADINRRDNNGRKHARKHFSSTNHPIIKSFEPGEDWGWCYVDELIFESFPGSLTTQWCGVLGATP